MGVGGAVLYSLGAMGVRATRRLARESINSLRRIWRVPSAATETSGRP